MENKIVNNIKQRLSLREPLAQALDVMAKLVERLDFKNRPSDGEAYAAFLEEQLRKVKEVCPACKNFERDFPSFAFSIATGIGKTRLMGACIAYLYLAKGIKHFFILAPNLTLYEKLMRDLVILLTKNMCSEAFRSLCTTSLISSLARTTTWREACLLKTRFR